MDKISGNISDIVEPVPSSKYYIVNGISFYLAGVVRTVLLPAGSTVGKAWGRIIVEPSLEHYSLQYSVSPLTYMNIANIVISKQIIGKTQTVHNLGKISDHWGGGFGSTLPVGNPVFYVGTALRTIFVADFTLQMQTFI